LEVASQKSPSHLEIAAIITIIIIIIIIIIISIITIISIIIIIIIIIIMDLQPFVGPWPLLQFLDITHCR
jgi:hypothetical protein